ncbi:2OG-Fe(II) oxygenase superfamily protein [Chryseobacterium arachidis]|uniref:2OG-Fe(II) oxygenase superfamily protein n=1 Tax=Chryseobacterium arachidis TaxID=1416778 RepID=A0A1M5B2L8_9FLAO|nr:alpha-ketoglutarate-dependent dioxygenase AlkB [Chryseobacterium arachidis]SHF36656.1 2OG-Fe(II) oxygenase superfamily protein [Chryseobacterium arachidis]
MNNSGFYQLQLSFKENLFKDLFNSTEFEISGKGRLGNHLVKMDDGNIAVVRTTTRYTIPATVFSPIHDSLINSINEKISTENITLPEQNFNNALIEVYDSSYSKMNFHSDQALDLDEKSCIALFSCYENPDELEEFHLRKLVVKDKTNEEEFEIVLNHNSVVLFSVETNRKFQHKIILDSKQNPKPLTDNKWLGITFRTSKTCIQFKNDIPYFSTGELFTLADKEQESDFFKLRGQENRSLDFAYPDLSYTISPADLMIPKSKK